MKRIGRLLFDIIGVAAAVAALVMVFYVFFKQLPTTKDSTGAEIKAAVKGWKLLRDADSTAFYLGVTALVLGGISLIGGIIAILMIFKKGSHMGLTAFVFVLAIAAVGIAAYVLHKHNDLSHAWNDAISWAKHI